MNQFQHCMKTLITLCLLLVVSFGINAQTKDLNTRARQDTIIATYLKRGAWKHSYFDKEWEQYIVKGLAEDSTVAYLWQQRAMPYFKQHKYDIGIRYLNKAVTYDTKWSDYRAYMECIFMKNYPQALIHFEQCKQLQPGGVVMDHPYDFYIALCHLQLNEYTEALTILNRLVQQTTDSKGKEWVHPNDLYYLGITYYELGKYTEAIQTFDEAITLYHNFADAKYYKGKCYAQQQQDVLSKTAFKEADEDFAKGYTINEDNIIYEYYPYQVYWKWKRGGG
jgi:tetratricopeptide (TPR) repeat protein